MIAVGSRLTATAADADSPTRKIELRGIAGEQRTELLARDFRDEAARERGR